MNSAIQRHFTATGIVIDDQCKTLLVLHKKLGVWLPPGGHVENGETPDHAALREIYEETGVIASIAPISEDSSLNDEWAKALPQPMCILLEDVGRSGDHFHIDLVYLCRAENKATRANVDETLGVGWFDESELGKLEMYPNVRAVIKKALSMRT